MKKRAVSWILTLAFCLSMLPTAALAAEDDNGISVQDIKTAEIYPDDVDADGNITSGGFQASGSVYTGSTRDETFIGGNFYIVQDDVTIDGDLTIDGSQIGGLVLCKGVTLTVKGALIHTGGTKFQIWGQSNAGKNAGRLVIENFDGDGAAIRSTGNGSQLGINSGELEIHGGDSKQLVEGVSLYSTASIHKATLDDKVVSPVEWEKTSIEGSKLVIKYCDHNAKDIGCISDDDSTHHERCTRCGFEWKTKEKHELIPGEITETTHTMRCKVCNYETQPEEHAFVDVKDPVPTTDGRGHSGKMCEVCAKPENEYVPHDFNLETGECKDCEFKPVAKVKKADDVYNFYDYINAAVIEAITHNNPTVTLENQTSNNKTINSYVSFYWGDDEGAELEMNGYTLQNAGKPVITVENGTLTVTGDATVVQGGSGEQAAPAIRVTGGTLVFDGKLTATGGNGKYAVEVTNDGTLTLQKGGTLNGGVSVEGSSNYKNVNALLGDGFAFANANKELVDGSGTTIDGNVTVIPHTEHIYMGGACACGKRKTVATIGDTEYDNMTTAINTWLANGGTLKLYADGGTVSFDNVNVTDKAYTIDLNGYRINCDYSGGNTPVDLNGARLTIQDSTGDNINGAFGPINANSGRLTLNSGRVQGLTVSADSEATVMLCGGKVSAINSAKPVYTLMPNGYALMNSNNTVDPAESLSSSTETYTIKDTQTKIISCEKSGETAFGSQTIPFELRLTTDDGEVGCMSFKWYRIDSDGKAIELAGFTEDETPVEGVYTFNPKHVKITADGWNGMTPGEYNVICVVTGMASDGAYRWKTALGGYTLTVGQASIADADVTVTNNPTYNGTPQSPTVKVELGGKELTEGTDYTVSDNSRTNAGDYTLTINGKGNYTGEKTASWSIAPKTVANATVTVDGDSFTYTGNPIKPTVTVKDGETVIPEREYTVSYEDNVNAGKAYVYIKDNDGGNYIVGGRTTFTTFTIGQAAAPEVHVPIGTLTVVNKLQKTYTVELSTLLPKLNYGGWIDYVGDHESIAALGDYYTKDATVLNGKLTLPINAVNTDKTGKIGMIIVGVASTNYKSFKLEIDVIATNKILPQGTPTLSKTAITYGEAINTITLSGTMKDGEEDVAGTFTWSAGDVKPNAGKCYVTWIFTPTNTEKYVTTSGDVEITVNKATPTGAPKYTPITASGKTLEDAHLTLEDSTLKPQAGSIVWLDEDGDYLDNKTKVEANKAYKWRFTPDDKKTTLL